MQISRERKITVVLTVAEIVAALKAAFPNDIVIQSLIERPTLSGSAGGITLVSSRPADGV
jgi:hypothetical protein